jgi:hypothetical protein
LPAPAGIRAPVAPDRDPSALEALAQTVLPSVPERGPGVVDEGGRGPGRARPRAGSLVVEAEPRVQFLHARAKPSERIAHGPRDPARERDSATVEQPLA